MIEVESRPRPHTEIYFVEGWQAREDIFIDRGKFRLASNKILTLAGLHKVGHAKTEPWEGQGWSYSANLSESIVAGGTWEEYNRYIYYLFHTCAPGLDLSNLDEIVKNVMECQEVEFRQLFKSPRTLPIFSPAAYTSQLTL